MGTSPLPRHAVFRDKRCRVLYYVGENRWRILLPDDTQRTVDTSHLTMLS